jgi:hypothetical protein
MIYEFNHRKAPVSAQFLYLCANKLATQVGTELKDDLKQITNSVTFYGINVGISPSLAQFFNSYFFPCDCSFPLRPIPELPRC